PEDLIRALEKRGRPQSRFTLLAPISGVITELMAREGMTVTVGSSLFRINGLRKVWVNAEVAETLGERVHRGDAVHARTAALPGVAFDGRVGAILPSVNVETGAQGGGQTEIRSGLTVGQKVVVSGQFLIDSEASLKATEARLQ